MEEVLQEFTRQMREARIANRHSRTLESERLYIEAAKYARDHEWEAEAQIADAAVQQLQGQLDQAEEDLQRLTKISELKGLAYFYLGSVQRGLGRWDAGVESYYRVREDPRFDWRDLVKDNLGNLYELRAAEKQGDKRESDEKEALKCYEEALDLCVDAQTRYILKYNRGRMCLKRDRYEDAVKSLEEALKEARASTPSVLSFCGRIGRELGTAYFIRATRGDLDAEMIQNTIDATRGKLDAETIRDTILVAHGDHLDAELIQDKAIPRWDQAADALFLAASDLPSDRAEQERNKAAIVRAKSQRAQRLLDERERTERDPKRERRIKRGTDDFHLLEWIPPSDVQVDTGYSSPEEPIFTRILAAEHDAFQKFAKERKESDFKSVLAILRSWGSAATLLDEGVGSECRGGGYFLKWRNTGLVIDPGIHFLRNFRDCGFHLREINGIVISHDHPDHNLDLKSFDDLRYELYKRASNKDEREMWRYTLVMDADTKRRFRGRFPSLRWPPQIRAPIKTFELNRYEQYVQNRPPEEIGPEELKRVTIDLKDEADLPFRIRFFNADHSEDVPGAVGFRIDCLADEWPYEALVKIGFTGDTGFFDELCDENHLGDCDILIPHISQPDFWELLSPDGVKEDAKHLGYRGVEKLITGCNSQPDLTLIGEFWSGLADSRIDIVEGLRRACQTEAIMPGSVGLLVNPQTRQIRCSNEKCSDWKPPDEIRVVAPRSDEHRFGPLRYLCQRCSKRLRQ